MNIYESCNWQMIKVQRYDINVADQKSVNVQKTRYINVANFKLAESQYYVNITNITLI